MEPSKSIYYVQKPKLSKFYSKDLTMSMIDEMKICTNENFPLYGSAPMQKSSGGLVKEHLSVTIALGRLRFNRGYKTHISFFVHACCCVKSTQKEVYIGHTYIKASSCKHLKGNRTQSEANAIITVACSTPLL